MFEDIDEDIRFTCHNITKKLKKNIKNIFRAEKSENYWSYNVKNSWKRFLDLNYVYFDTKFVSIAILEAKIYQFKDRQWPFWKTPIYPV